MVYDFKEKIPSFAFHKLEFFINVCGWKLELHYDFH